MVIHEEEIINNLIEKQMEAFDLLVMPNSSNLLLFAEDEPDAQNDLESYIEAKYLKGVVEPMVSFEISSAVNRGRDNAIKSIDGINFAFAEWSANMEGNPCPYCADKNGQIISIDNPDYMDCQPPVHINCECIWVYITDQERTGNGDPIEENWKSPGDDDRLKYRIFDIYNAKDMDKLADVFANKAVRISENDEKRLQDKIQELQKRPWKSGIFEVEKIHWYQKIEDTDSEQVKEEKRYNNAEVICKSTKWKISDITEKDITNDLNLARTEQDEKNWGIGKHSGGLYTLGAYDENKDKIYFSKDVVNSIGDGDLKYMPTVFQEYIHAISKNEPPLGGGNYREALDGLTAWGLSNKYLKDFSLQHEIQSSLYFNANSDMLLQVIGEYHNCNTPEKIFNKLISFKKLDKDSNEAKEIKKTINLSENITQMEYNNYLNEALKNGIIKDKELRKYVNDYIGENKVEDKKVKVNRDYTIQEGILKCYLAEENQ